jgi:arsenite methyltransferase
MTETDQVDLMAGINGYLRLRQHLSRPFPRRLLASCRAPGVRNFLRGLDRTLLRFYPPDIRLRHEFNRWAKKGLGDSMELVHKWVAERTIPTMGLVSGDCVLDLGCGDGWASRLLAEHLNRRGRVVGLDVSDEMIRRARIKNSTAEKLTFLCGSAERIPFRNGTFSKVLSISAFYYFENQKTVLTELFRVLAPGGKLFLITFLYKGVPNWRSSARELNVPVHVRSAAEYKSMLETAGWAEIRTDELLQQPELVESTAGHERALLIRARKA